MIEIDTQDPSSLTYKGENVGRHVYSDGLSTVIMKLTYDCPLQQWSDPLVAFTRTLGQIHLTSTSLGAASSLTYDVSISNGRAKVTVNARYACEGSDWIVPLSYFALELRKIEPEVGPACLTFSADEEDFEWVPTREPSLLLEKKLSAGGSAWIFHKSDADPWPSPLHGHNYERGLVINGVTGEIFATTNRKSQGKLKPKQLTELHAKIRAVNDLEHLWQLLPPPPP